MAKNPKNITALGLHPEGFQETRIPAGKDIAHTHTHVDESTPTHNHTQEYTHKQIDVYEPQQRETKTKRIQLLTYESLIQRMDAYAAKRGVKRVAVFEAAVEAYLDKVDPKE